jgi:hypothetical protein
MLNEKPLDNEASRSAERRQFKNRAILPTLTKRVLEHESEAAANTFGLVFQPILFEMNEQFIERRSADRRKAAKRVARTNVAINVLMLIIGIAIGCFYTSRQAAEYVLACVG